MNRIIWNLYHLSLIKLKSMHHLNQGEWMQIMTMLYKHFILEKYQHPQMSQVRKIC